MSTALLTRRHYQLPCGCYSFGQVVPDSRSLAIFLASGLPRPHSPPVALVLGRRVLYISPANHSPRSHFALATSSPPSCSALRLKVKTHNIPFLLRATMEAHFFAEFPCFPVCRAYLSSYFPAFLQLQHPLFSCLPYPSCSPLYLITLSLCIFCPSCFSLFFQVHPPIFTFPCLSYSPISVFSHFPPSLPLSPNFMFPCLSDPTLFPYFPIISYFRVFL